MPRGSTRRDPIALGLCVGAALFALLVFVLFPIPRVDQRIWLVLPSLALLAEFLPVELSNRGLRVTFSLPYCVGVAVVAGPSAVLLTDLFVTVSAAVALGKWKKQVATPYWIGMNLAVAAISCGLAGIAFRGIQVAAADLTGTTSLAALTFTLVYGTANVTLVALLESLHGMGVRHAPLWRTMRSQMRGAVLYALLAIAVAMLVHRSLIEWVPLTLLPVWALRTGLILRSRMEEHYYETISALSLMLQRAHPYTHGHLERVALLSEEVALELGLSAENARLVREASVLHDIGKIAIDEAILDKPGKLDEREYAHVKQHSAFGAAILAPVGSFRDLVPWIRHHHERPDGKGYPDGLVGDEIPLESRIIAVADAYDAMTGTDIADGGRKYRAPMTRDQAIQELERCAGTQFDERVVATFKSVLLQGAS